VPDPRFDETRPEITRRIMLRGAAVSGVALPLLAACGDDGGSADAPETSAGAEESAPAESPSAAEEGGAATGLVSTADVPVGGGMILKDEKIVVTQPAEGDFKAFTAVCTHQQCLVGTVENGTIMCPCHGSQFSIEDGSVTGGPAPAPLAEVPITVEGDQIVAG
jgi:Rieske Fe-S protein